MSLPVQGCVIHAHPSIHPPTLPPSHTPSHPHPPTHTGESITFWNPDYDKECTPALIKIARDANQEVPEWLDKHGSAKASKLWKVEKAVLA